MVEGEHRGSAELAGKLGRTAGGRQPYIGIAAGGGSGAFEVGDRERGVIGELEAGHRFDPAGQEGAPNSLGTGDGEEQTGSEASQRGQIDRLSGGVERARDGAWEAD